MSCRIWRLKPFRWNPDDILLLPRSKRRGPIGSQACREVCLSCARERNEHDGCRLVRDDNLDDTIGHFKGVDRGEDVGSRVEITLQDPRAPCTRRREEEFPLDGRRVAMEYHREHQAQAPVREVVRNFRGM